MGYIPRLDKGSLKLLFWLKGFAVSCERLVRLEKMRKDDILMCLNPPTLEASGRLVYSTSLAYVF